MRNKDMQESEMGPLIKEAFRVNGEVMVKHILSKPV